MSNVNEMGVGGIAGFQIPMGIKKRKKHVDELLKVNPDVSEGHALMFFNGMSEEIAEDIGQRLEQQNYESVANEIRMHAIRELVRQRVKEVVRKKAGGGGFVLYSPNRGKKKNPKPVGHFPTKIAAKRAELARFPPKDPGKLQRLRKEVDRMKNPKKRAEKEKAASKEKGNDRRKEGLELREASPGWLKYKLDWNDDNDPQGVAKKGIDTLRQKFKAVTRVGHGYGGQELHIMVPQAQQSAFEQWLKDEYGVSDESEMDDLRVKEGIELLRPLISVLVMESLFREERTGSEWDDYIGRLSTQALTGDKKFQKHQQGIEKKTQGILENAFNSIRKAVAKDIKLKSFGVKKSEEKGKTYLAFSANMDGVAVEPIYIYVDNGVPKIEVSDNARIALTKAEPDKAKLFRAELVTVQERVLDKMDDLIDAIAARDKYLEHLEDDVDGFVAGLTPLQVSLLKQLLVKKYRKIS